jgi:hypothetical protein
VTTSGTAYARNRVRHGLAVSAFSTYEASEVPEGFYCFSPTIRPQTRSVGLGIGYVRMMIVFGLDRIGVSSIRGDSDRVT